MIALVELNTLLIRTHQYKEKGTRASKSFDSLKKSLCSLLYYYYNAFPRALYRVFLSVRMRAAAEIIVEF